MTNRSLLAALAALSLVTVGACSCDEGPIGQADPLPEFEPTSLVYTGEACAGTTAKQTLTVVNKSRGQLSGTLSIEGKDAEDFRIADEDKEISLGGLGSKEIEVIFAPRAPSTGKGPKGLEASLVLRSNSERQPEVDATLDGQVSNLPLEPAFALQWSICHEGGDESPRVECGKDPLSACCGELDSLFFGKVSVDEVGSEDLLVRNDSCGALEITDAEVVPAPEVDDCGEGVLEFPDFKEAPLVIAGQGVEAVAVKFTPTHDCNLDRQLILHSNDESRPTLSVRITGNGIQAFLDYIPDSLVFGTVPQGQSKTLKTTGYNRGGEAVLISRIAIDGASKEHFRFASVQHCGNEVDLDALADEPLELLKKSEECQRSLDFVVEYAPKGPGVHNDAALYVEHNLGTDKVPLNGRSAPRLVVYPQMIAFDTPKETGCGGQDDYACGSCTNNTAAAAKCTDDLDCLQGEACLDGICSSDAEPICLTTCGDASRSFRLANDGVSDLVITRLSLEDEKGNPGSPKDPDKRGDTYGEDVFQLDAGNCKGTVKPGDFCEGKIHVTDNYNGGEMRAFLRVESNDPSWGDEGMPVEIVKFSVTPVAPEVSFPRPSFPRVNEWVRVDASGSSAKQGTLTRFEWEVTPAVPTSKLPPGKIDPKNPDQGCARPDGECFRLLNSSEAPCNTNGSDCSILEFKPDLPIIFKVKVRAEGSVCSPPYGREWEDDISPVAN